MFWAFIKGKFPKKERKIQPSCINKKVSFFTKEKSSCSYFLKPIPNEISPPKQMRQICFDNKKIHHSQWDLTGSMENSSYFQILRQQGKNAWFWKDDIFSFPSEMNQSMNIVWYVCSGDVENRLNVQYCSFPKKAVTFLFDHETLSHDYKGTINFVSCDVFCFCYVNKYFITFHFKTANIHCTVHFLIQPAKRMMLKRREQVV